MRRQDAEPGAPVIHEIAKLQFRLARVAAACSLSALSCLVLGLCLMCHICLQKLDAACLLLATAPLLAWF